MQEEVKKQYQKIVQEKEELVKKNTQIENDLKTR